MSFVNYANRGAMLEEIIKISNNQYEIRDIAQIDKVPTPVKILSIKKNKVIGFLEKKSTVDYTGILYNGKAIAFDAKETKERSFPLKNIHDHQYRHLRRVHSMNGVAFLVVGFIFTNEYFRLPFSELKNYWEKWKANKGRRGYASIPYMAFKNKLRSREGIALDYLEGLV